jgi:hypothetical protein
MKCPGSRCKPYLAPGTMIAAWCCAFAITHAGADDEKEVATERTFAPKHVPASQVEPLPDDKATFTYFDKERTRFHFGKDLRRPFWFPLVGPDGKSLTRMGHPHDPVTHSHHNSLWISHASVDGINFWGDQGKGLGRIVTRQVSEYEDVDDFSAMRSVHHWIDETSGDVLLIEYRRCEVRPFAGAKEDSKDDWMLVIDLEFNVPDGRAATTFDSSGFGIIGVRMAKTIGVHDGGGRILNSEGQWNEEEVFRKPARWVDYSGAVTDSAAGGISLMDHPGNPNFPSPFHVRNDGWMGACLNLDEPIVVTGEQPLRLRYGLWIHRGVPAKDLADAAWQSFSKLDPVSARKP